MIPQNLPENGALAARKRALAAKKAANAGAGGGGFPGAPQPQQQLQQAQPQQQQQNQQQNQAAANESGDLPFQQEDISSIGNYQVIESIGRGAFGIVYRGLSPSFETVAIKRVFLPNVPVSELESIEMEIQLLKNLKHNNIVEYRDALRTSSHLNIVLEFVENGSLSSLLGKMKGRTLPERFVAHYTYQVLVGLAYLHTQGVIHRDIKGANILSTKQGLVKLADFGVATKLNDSRKSDSVVGTPYWMAPEIIEMKGGQSPACDIWSVGCTVIELLTGKPPYFDLPQMTALFKIVQDDLPPLPDGITPLCEDFLRECFQKDPVRRPPADKLLKHAWLKEAAASVQDMEQQINAPTGSTSLGVKGGNVLVPEVDEDDPFGSDFDDDNDEVKTQKTTSPKPAPKSNKNLTKWAENSGDDDEEWDLDEEPSSPAKPNQPADKGRRGTVVPISNKPKTNNMLPVWDDDDDDWGDIDSAPKTKLGLTSPALAKGKQTVSPPLGKAGVGAHLQPTKKVNLDDYAATEEVDEFSDLDLDSKLTSMASASAGNKGNVTQQFIGTGSGTLKRPLVSHPVSTKSDDAEDSDPFDELELNVQDENTALMQQFDKYVQELNHYAKQAVRNTKSIQDLADKLTIFITNNPTLTVLPRVVLPLIDLLPVVEEPALYSLTLLSILLSQSTLLQQHHVFVLLVPALLPFAGPSASLRVRMSVCTIINSLCRGDDFTRRVLIASGGLQLVLDLLCSDHNSQHNEWLVLLSAIENLKMLLVQGKNDILRMCCTLNGPIQIATTLFRLATCAVGVLPVDFIETSPNEHGEVKLVPILIPPSTNSFQTLNMANISHPITITKLPLQLNTTLADPITKLVSILELFVNGDAIVKESLCNPNVFQILINLLPLLQQDGTTPILKMLRVLSILPVAHPVFESTQAIPVLVSFLYSSIFEHQHHALQCLYHLCATNPQRQFRAVQAGIIPILINNIKQKDPLSHFAYPMLFWFAQTSVPRLEVRKNGGFDLFLDALSNPSFNLNALDALIAMITEKHELQVPKSLQTQLAEQYKQVRPSGAAGNTTWYSVSANAELMTLEQGLQRYLPTLCLPTNLMRILYVVQTAASNGIGYERVMSSLEKLLARSTQFAVCMSVVLLPEIASRLPSFHTQNNVRSAILNLLKVCLTTLGFEFNAVNPKPYLTPTVRDNLYHTLQESLEPTLKDVVSGSAGFALIQSRAKGCLTEINKILKSK